MFALSNYELQIRVRTRVDWRAIPRNGGRLHLYSNVTRRGTLKDQTRRMIHRTSARTLKEWTWPVGKRHKEVAEMDKAVQSSCGNAASNARPATALPLMEPASDHRVKERRQWAE
ncbi:hypothetical protein KEM54_002487, partial [Ascosphaera aggregata]